MMSRISLLLLAAVLAAVTAASLLDHESKSSRQQRSQLLGSAASSRQQRSQLLESAASSRQQRSQLLGSAANNEEESELNQLTKRKVRKTHKPRKPRRPMSAHLTMRGRYLDDLGEESSEDFDLFEDEDDEYVLRNLQTRDYPFLYSGIPILAKRAQPAQQLKRGSQTAQSGLEMIKRFFLDAEAVHQLQQQQQQQKKRGSKAAVRGLEMIKRLFVDEE